MGGNALKQFGIETDRLPKAEYEAIVGEVIAIIRDNLEHNGFTRSVNAIQSYRNKQDFGDADILMDSSGLPSDWIEKLKNKFNSKAIYPNGDVVSFEFKNFQVDVIKTPASEFMAAYNYFAWNDLGNITGRLAHKFGIKYGHDGSHYIMRDGDRVIGDVLISHDPFMLFDFLGLDSQRYLQGFDELEDMFEWISESKYFNPNIYTFDNLNHTQRVRDRKRSTYNKFLKWCEDLPKKDWYQFKEDKSEYLPMLFDHFGGEDGWNIPFEEKYFGMMANDMFNQYVSKKFNAKLVMELTGLQGKELGVFMTRFKEKHSNKKLAVYSDEYIKKLILNQQLSY